MLDYSDSRLIQLMTQYGEWVADSDLEGQIIIYTGLTEDSLGNVVPWQTGA